MTATLSAGILLYRRTGAEPEVLLAHPGGPYWQRQDYGSWSVPKGITEGEEALEAVAAREFEEETGFALASCARASDGRWLDLGEIQLKSGKTAIFIIFQTEEAGIGIPISLAGFKEALAELK